MNAKDSSITMLRQFFLMITFQKTTSVQKTSARGALKQKTFNENAAFCLTSLRSTSSPSSNMQHLMARCPESWFAGATSGQAPQFLSDTNDTETT